MITTCGGAGKIIGGGRGMLILTLTCAIAVEATIKNTKTIVV
jgi:hypothetical protein